MDYGWWEWRWETRGESTSVIQVGDGWTMLVAVVGDAFYENCLFTSLAHFQLGSCFRIICQGFLYYPGYLCHLFGVLVGLWYYETSPPSARDLASHCLAEKAQEVRGLCTVIFPAQAPILPQPQCPASILHLGLWTDTLPKTVPASQPASAAIQVLSCVVSNNSSRNGSLLFQGERPAFLLSKPSLYIRSSKWPSHISFLGSPAYILLSATICVALAQPLSCVTKYKLLNLSVPPVHHLQNVDGSCLPGLLQRQCMRKLTRTLHITR